MFVGELELDGLGDADPGVDAATGHDTPTSGEYGEAGAVYDNSQAAQVAANITGTPQGYEQPTGQVVTMVPQTPAAQVASGTAAATRQVAAQMAVQTGGIAGLPWKTVLIIGGVVVLGAMLLKGRLGSRLGGKRRRARR